MWRFNSFSSGQKAIHVGITLGFNKAPGFRPSLKNTRKSNYGRHPGAIFMLVVFPFVAQEVKN